MNGTIDDYLNKIDARIASRHLLTHPFYMAWTRGELSKECLADYADQYYHHVKAFPTYLSAVHSHTDDAETRKLLLQNLMDEEAGTPNHPDLWKAFGQSLGFVESEAREPIQQMIQTFQDICRNGSVEEGLAALYTYESQIPDVSISKIKGLREYYGMKHPHDWKYFTIHIEADKEHAAVERALLARYLSNENWEKVLAAVDRVLDRLWGFLTSLSEKYGIACVETVGV